MVTAFRLAAGRMESDPAASVRAVSDWAVHNAVILTLKRERPIVLNVNILRM